MEQSAVTLIQGVSAQIAAAATDPAKIAALAAQLQNSAASPCAATISNTRVGP